MTTALQPTVKSTDDVRSRDARSRVIEVATRMFAEHGFDGVSLRQVTAAAKVNVGAVNYHFGSKDHLIREVFRSLAEPVNRLRLTELDKYEKERQGKLPEVKPLVRALIAPAVRSAADATGGGFYLARLLVLARALPRPFITSILSEHYDVVFHRFVQAFSRALPGLPYDEVCWRYDFAIGALLFVVGHFDGGTRMKRLTGGLCDTRDVERIVDELVAFVEGGVQAASVPRRSALAQLSVPQRPVEGARRRDDEDGSENRV